MSKRFVLIDTSAWVSYLGGSSNGQSKGIVQLLHSERAAINAVIRMEVLTGALNDAQYAELEDTLQALHHLPLSDAVWRRAERIRFELRRSGLLIPVPDVVIASCALIYDCELLHADRHFTLMARSLPLKFYSHPRSS